MTIPDVISEKFIARPDELEYVGRLREAAASSKLKKEIKDLRRKLNEGTDE